jgi:hypothetical protein
MRANRRQGPDFSERPKPFFTAFIIWIWHSYLCNNPGRSKAGSRTSLTVGGRYRYHTSLASKPSIPDQEPNVCSRFVTAAADTDAARTPTASTDFVDKDDKKVHSSAC